MVKGFTKDHKFHPITQYKKGTRKSRDEKAKTKGIKIRKGRWDNDIDPTRYLVVKVKRTDSGRRLMSSVREELDKGRYFTTGNFGKAVRAVDFGDFNTIIDTETKDIVDSSMKKRDVDISNCNCSCGCKTQTNGTDLCMNCEGMQNG